MSFARFLRANAPFLSVGVLLTFLSSFGQTFFISVFAGEIRAEFGLSHGAWGGIYSLGTTASAALMIWLGTLTDRHRVRVLAPFVLAGLSAACLFMAAVPVVWLLPLAIFFLRFLGQGMSTHIAVVAMARWFVASRGRALSVATLGVAAGEALLPLLFVALLGVYDWRTLWLVAAVVIAVLIPVIGPLLRLERTPQSIAESGASLGMEGRHWTRRDMTRHWLFWLIVPALLAPPAFATAFFFQQVHIAESKGWAHLQIAAMFPVFTLSGVVGLLLSGALIDRIGTGRLMPLAQLPMALGFLLFGLTESLVAAGVAMALMGLSQGANSTVPNAFWAEFYGTRHLGAIKSLTVAIMVFGTAIGPALTGVLIDAGLAFTTQMPGIAGYFVFAALLVGLGMAWARPLLSPPAEVDIERA
ncbi:MFS transporter [Palleronia sp. KMU-117]|uniref:MFS transporter n=1 Tax=Palleronia sp. KMU-117 TaxID=3434108 RepID=UPI003D73BF74